MTKSDGFNVEVLKTLINSYIALLEPITPIGSNRKAVFCYGTAKDDGAMIPVPCQLCPEVLSRDPSAIRTDAFRAVLRMIEDIERATSPALKAICSKCRGTNTSPAGPQAADGTGKRVCLDCGLIFVAGPPLDARWYVITDGNRFFRASLNHGDPGSGERWTSVRCRATQYSSLEAMPSTIIGPKPDEDVLTATTETGGAGITYVKTEGDCIFCIAWSTEA